MVREMALYYPNYLSDFDELKAISNAQRRSYLAVETAAERAKQKMTFYLRSDEWEDILKLNYSNADWRDKTYTMLHRYTSVTKEDYEKMVDSRLSGNFVLEIDYENLAVVLKTTRKKYDVHKIMGYIREMFPCNMTFEVQYVSEL